MTYLDDLTKAAATTFDAFDFRLAVHDRDAPIRAVTEAVAAKVLRDMLAEVGDMPFGQLDDMDYTDDIRSWAAERGINLESQP